MPDTQRRPLGAVPSPADHRDFIAQALPPLQHSTLPPVHLTPNLPPVRDQGQEGTCVGHALVGILDYYENKSGWGRKLSVRDAYAGARLLEPVAGEGAQPRAALKNAQQAGVCPETDWPYIAGTAGTPSNQAESHRPPNRVGAYAQVGRTVADLRGALVHQGPLLVVIPVTDGFWTPDAHGQVTYKGAVAGYHAVALVGYDETRQAFRLRNSWGAAWGEGGYCWLPYGHPITEAWTLTAVLTAQSGPARPWWAFWQT